MNDMHTTRGADDRILHRQFRWLFLLSLTTALFGCGAHDASGDTADRQPHRTGAGTEEPLLPAIVTERVPGDGDDPAIWIHPEDPAQSLVLGTDKGRRNGGVYVFGLDGRIDRTRTVTGLRRPNNVDVGYGFRVGGRGVDIAVATERNSTSLRVFALPDMRPVDGGGIPVFDGDTEREPMGIALYRRPRDGAMFAIVAGKQGPTEGYLWQYRLEDDGAGRVRGVKVREFGTFSGRQEIEAIAVDQALGYVYYSDEQFGIRKYHADPKAGDRQLAQFGTDHFARDHEGIALYTSEDGTGYILVSDQQAGRLQVFPREGVSGRPHHHPLLASIPVSALETDGVAVVSAGLGTGFPRGMVVMMSADRTFHFYRWEDVEARIPPGARESPSHP
ncbi:MAG: phytase [Gemmatimonadetes bacterium]|nr:phytase [Gemmatimonadota bacterium]